MDISDVQIARARRLVPGATFFAADIAEVSFAEASFDAVCSFYALIHLPHDEQRRVIDRIGQWLKPGGVFLATVGHTAWTGEEPRWLGGNAAMWWSQAGAATYRAWIRQAGLEVADQQFVTEGDSGHALFWARQPSADPPRQAETCSKESSPPTPG